MKKWLFLILLSSPCYGGDQGASVNPKSLLRSTSTWTAPQVFQGTVTYSSNQRPVVASTPIATIFDVQQATMAYSSSTSLFLSTYAANFCNGCLLYFSSGAIASNTSVTISITGVTTFLIPVCTELEGVNTAVVSVRVKSIAADRSSFIVYNADAINNKNFVCVVAGK